MTNTTGLSFYPSNLQAKVGDRVQFQYWGSRSNHTVTESTFDRPCTPKAGGINSGFQPVNEAEGRIPLFTITINDTTPKWFYCAQGRHCQSGMVMVINEDASRNATRTLNTYKSDSARALQSPDSGTSAGTGVISGGTSGTTNAPAASASANGASSLSVAVPATMLLVLGSAFMLL